MEGKTSVVVRLRCRSGIAGGHPPREVESILLSGLPCTDALTLADVFDAAKQPVPVSNNGGVQSEPRPHNGIDAGTSADPFAGLRANTDEATHQCCTSTPLPQAAGDPRNALRRYSSIFLSSSRGVAPNSPVRTPPSIKGSSRSGVQTKPTRSISFTDLADQDGSPSGPGRQQQQLQHAKSQNEASSLPNGETTAYRKYARMLGIEPQPPRRSLAVPHTPVTGLPSSVSFGDSFGSGQTSAVYTPLGGALRFPRHDSAALFHASSEENELTLQDGTLSEPAGVSRAPRQERRNGEAERYDDRGAPREHNKLRIIVPEVETTSDAPQWFPAAPALSEESEVSLSSASCSVHRYGTATAPAVAPVAAAASASSPTVARHESLGHVPAFEYAGSLPPQERSDTNCHDLFERKRTPINLDGAPHDIVFPPLPPSVSSPFTPSSSSLPPAPFSAAVAAPASVAAVAQEESNAALAFCYLTSAQRRLINFHELLRPTIPPPDAAGAGASASTALSTPTPAAPFRSATSSPRPPAALDQVLLKLRLNSLPTTVIPTATPLPQPTTTAAAAPEAELHVQSGGAERASADPLRAAPDTAQTPPSHPLSKTASEALVSPASASLGSSIPPAAASSSVSFTKNTKEPSAVAVPRAAGHLVSSYRQALLQRRDRHLRGASGPCATSTSAMVTPPTLSLSPQWSMKWSGADELDIPAAAAPQGGDAPTVVAQKDSCEDTSTRAVRGRGSAVPQRAHGPFAQPSQHPPSTFLARGGHRSPASSSLSPQRRRRLPASPPPRFPSDGGEREPQTGSATPSSVQTNSHGIGAGGNKYSNEWSSSPDSSMALSSPPWRNARTRPSQNIRSPQSPPEMRPRSSRPFIGTPKLALDHPGTAVLASPPVLLGASLVDEDAEQSSTSMAT
ncbi:hypothetical protein ABB37_04391 [Leptomonas pyrrhocoris]|uniref:Uncharacterized protein n=1 Tax=Leptomonas pyrrhocoris TaxID=157538 RepID=A0A0N0DVZ0_LEPPY|nr:hypothetical protein ABB37_04391 [Leptomonas pyrrhocoris]KPA81018.1 hypothetical protein ABB37_04391 [Leptomonas pyrrhocoris]|eukprot:XP_015659457.1 hypothetical protein ABB37_04391 [Leptomonas pyrrhocoris]